MILSEDHKKPDAKGNFPTRLVAPATNFTAGFPKLGYLGVKSIFEENGICFGEKNLTQASELKEKLEQLGIKSSNSTIASVDAELMCPSIKCGLIV